MDEQYHLYHGPSPAHPVPLAELIKKWVCWHGEGTSAVSALISHE